jgi:hypothetical protein
MKAKALHLFFLLFLSCTLDAQRYSLAEQKRFAYYLYQAHRYDDFILQSDLIRRNYTLSGPENDTLFYYHANSLSGIGENENAAGFFIQVSAGAPFGLRSKFLAAEHYCKGLNFQYALNVVSAVQGPDSAVVQLRDFFLASLYLFRNDVKGFNAFDVSAPVQGGFFTAKRNALGVFAQRMQKAERKSMFLAGLMSAVVPGTGKIYAGKWRQGVMSLFPLAIMGLQAWEGYHKAGLTSPRFIVFGGLFSLFYIGNIWGSALSVSVRKQEIRNEIHQEMLVDLHLAVEHVLGKGR